MERLKIEDFQTNGAENTIVDLESTFKKWNLHIEKGSTEEAELIADIENTKQEIEKLEKFYEYLILQRCALSFKIWFCW